MILLLLSFTAGILTVLAPCTIALLPVIVGGTMSGEHNTRRTIVVTLSLGLSVILFTLLLKVSTAFIMVPESFWQIISGAIIIFLGLSMLIPALWENIPLVGALNRSSNKLIAEGYQKQSVFGDIIMGASLGPVFSSCSPTYFLILATVLPKSLAEGLLYLFVYTFGLSGMLFVVSIAGQRLLEKLGVASDPKGLFKRIIGVIFLVIGVLIAFGYERNLELSLINSGFFDVTGIEQKLLEAHPIAFSPTSSSTALVSTTSASTSEASYVKDAMMRIAAKSMQYQKAPEIVNPSAFINTDGQPITFGQFRGKKVVLVDFWTYSCINCQRTLPYLRAWYDKYKDQGLEIVSIHTPEFAFEKVESNVEQAVKADNLKYPVVMDNDYATWNAFANQYWPRKYLIDIDGFIVYDHIGEGNYAETEAAIQKALTERDDVLAATTTNLSGTVLPKDVIPMNATQVGSPETYFGSARNKYLANGSPGRAGMQNLTLPAAFDVNRLYLSGAWNFAPEYAESTAGAIIVYEYSAKNVYFVASSASGAKLLITVDGKAPGALAGKDVSPDGQAIIQANTLYELVHGAGYGTHMLRIEVQSGTLDAYTFTFG